MREDDGTGGASWPSLSFKRARELRHELLVCLLVALLAAAAGVGTTVGVQHALGDEPGMLSAADTGVLNDQAVYDKLEPGIVDVTGDMQYQEETAQGTGIVINAAAGLVLTNNHVIEDATGVTVTPVRSSRSYEAQVLGYDAADDVALLRVPDVAGLEAASIGDSARVTTGTQVLAIGNQAGQGGPPTVAPGIVSSLDRTVEASDEASGRNELLHGMLQTSAQIRPGDSGGPLADAAGQVIGIDTAAGGGNGFAIPINQAMSIAHRIAAGKAGDGVSLGLPAFLGVLTPDSHSTSPEQQASQQRHQQANAAGQLGCQAGTSATAPDQVAPAQSGALVDGVLCGSPASLAGVTAGDVITAFGGRPVTSPGSLNSIINGNRPGRTTWLDWVSPDGVTHSALVTLQSGPAG